MPTAAVDPLRSFDQFCYHDLMDDAETPLVGGRVTVGVARVGETVRRPIAGDRTLQHNLLAHLEQKGFVGCHDFSASMSWAGRF